MATDIYTCDHACTNNRAFPHASSNSNAHAHAYDQAYICTYTHRITGPRSNAYKYSCTLSDSQPNADIRAMGVGKS